MAHWSKNSLIVLEARYLARDNKGELIETSDEMLVRVANAIAEAEKNSAQAVWAEKFLQIMDRLEFLPNSPALMNAGRELCQLLACFVLPIEDDMSAIFEAVKQGAIIHQSGGGCFKKGTRIITRNGSKNIEDVIYNEEVLSYNIEGKIFEWGYIIGNYLVDVSNKEKVRIQFENGSEVVCTADHPFRVRFKDEELWIEAQDLIEEMEIIDVNEITERDIKL